MIDEETKTANLALWREVETTDPKFTKKMETGAKLTAICAQWQRKKATELWGPYGGKWGVKDATYTVMQLSENPRDAMLVYTGTFFCPIAEFQIATDIDLWMYSNYHKTYRKIGDPHKKVATDGLTKSLSLLGFSADVFMGLFDDSKYIEETKAEFDQQRKQKEKAKNEAKADERKQALAEWTLKLKEQTDVDSLQLVLSSAANFYKALADKEGYAEIKRLAGVKAKELQENETS